jgi:hypothetical protein
MPEDGDVGPHPQEHLHEVGEDGHEEDGVGGEVLKLKTELLQKQKEEGGDRRRHPAGDVCVEEDELPHDQVVEGARACPDLPGELRRGPPQEATHHVELFRLLDMAAIAANARGKDCKDAGRGRNTGRKKQIAKVRVEMKGRCGVWRRQV